jgi:hypothetical protein
MSETCNVCGEDIEGDHLYSNMHGTMCFPCVRKEWPDHLTDPEKHGMASKEIKYVRVSDGTGDDDGWFAYHESSGIAAFGVTKSRAKKLLDAIYSNVATVERNERYGSIME